MPIVRLATPAEVQTRLLASVASGETALFVFFGSEDPMTGESWCPDCVTADPILRRACTTLRPDLVLYECPVGARSSWKNQPDHPFRVHPTLRVARIPTLLFLENGLERGRLVEADCAQPAVVEAFIKR
jgi:thiol-disulfide isomerase/thioredoxin